jgi:hypothetical protein
MKGTLTTYLHSFKFDNPHDNVLRLFAAVSGLTGEPKTHYARARDSKIKPASRIAFR